MFAGRLAAFFLLTTLTWLSSLQSTVIAAQQAPEPRDQNQPQSKHGLQSHLEGHLHQSGELSRAFETVRTELTGAVRAERNRTGTQDSVMVLHQSLLMMPSDVFVFDRKGGKAESLKSSAVGLLVGASQRYRDAWRKTFHEPARAQLDAAVRSNSEKELLRTATGYLLTDPGFDAAVLLVLQRLDTAAVADAESLLQSLVMPYRSDRRFRNRCLQLNSIVQRAADRQRKSSLSTSTTSRVRRDLRQGASFPSGSLNSSDGSVSRPWPEPRWRWTERPWVYVESDSQSAFGSAEDDDVSPGFFGRNFGDGRNPEGDTTVFSNWRPVIRKNVVVTRSPERVAGLSRSTGDVLWEVPTEKYSDPVTGGRKQLDSILSGAFGRLSSDEDTVYFIDHVDRPPAMSGRGRRRGDRGLPGAAAGDDEVEDPLMTPPGMDYSGFGARLVALRFPKDSDVPRIAWVIGNTRDSAYAVRIFPEEKPSSASAEPANGAKAMRNNSAVSPSRSSGSQLKASDRFGLSRMDDPGNTPFSGHRFLCAPAGRDERLFVISAGLDQTWLNCLDRNSGRLLWRQPLTVDDDIPGPVETPTPAVSTTCLIQGDLVICCFPSGMNVAVRCADGALAWATSLRDEDLPTTVGLLNHDRSRRAEERSTAFIPATTSQLLIASSPFSSHVYALEAATGKILWQADRTIQDRSQAVSGKMTDTCLISADDSRIVLGGTHHCRALDAQTGSQLWIAGINSLSGSPVCIGDRCLIPESDGTVTSINTKTGLTDRVHPRFLPEQAQLHRGTITCDDEFTYVSTFASITAYPRSDVVLQTLEASSRATHGPKGASVVTSSDTLKIAQARALSETRSETIRRLIQEYRQPDVTVADQHTAAASDRLDDFISEQLLLYSGSLLFPSSVRQNQRPVASGSGAARTRVLGADDAAADMFGNEAQQLLARLSLRPDQQLRADLFHVLSELSSDGKSAAGSANSGKIGKPLQNKKMDRQNAAVYERLVQTPLEQNITIDGDWQVRADLLLSAELFAAQQAGTPNHEWMLPLKNAILNQRTEAGGLIDEAGLIDSVAKPDESDKLSPGRILLNSGRLDAAELVTLAAIQSLSDRSRDQSGELKVVPRTNAVPDANEELPVRELRQLLQQIRNEPAVYENPELKHSESEIRLTKERQRNTDSILPPHPNVKEKHRVRFLKIRTSQSTTAPDPLFSQLSQLTSVFSSPPRSSLRWLIEERRNGDAMMKAFELRDGSLTDEVVLPFSPEAVETPEGDADAPRIMTLAGSRQIAAISWVRPGSARLLWHRNVTSESRRRVSVIPGPICAGRCIWQSADRLHCSSVLTGKDFWSRDCNQPPRDDFSRSHLLFGDESVTVLMDPSNESYRRYRTRDGRTLGDGQIDIGRGTSVEIVGRKVLYSDRTGRVRLYDFLQNRDLLAEQPAVQMIPGEGLFRRLPGGLVATISGNFESGFTDRAGSTPGHEIVVIDTKQNRVRFRTPIGSQLNTRYVFGFTAFERNGKFFVCVNDEQAFGQQFEAFAQLGEPRLDFGRLFCLDSTDGKILWSHRTQPSVVPPIMGDDSDILVMWSMVMPARRNSIAGQSRRLRVQVLDLQHGEVLAESSDLDAVVPLRCVHDAVSSRTTLYCRNSATSGTAQLIAPPAIEITEQLPVHSDSP